MTSRTVSNGYGIKHKTQRTLWANHIDTHGAVQCACTGHCTKHQGQCTIMINNDMQWDLGHHDQDRSRYVGPECITCNRTAGGITRRTQQTMIIREW